MAESDDSGAAPGKGRVNSLNLDRLTVAELTTVIEMAEALTGKAGGSQGRAAGEVASRSC